jgi:acyl-CoA thioesterase-1
MLQNIKLKDNDMILFIGDSITDVDRRKPEYAPLGCGYVNFAANLIIARHAQISLKVENTGISGNTVRDLKKRWRTDCLAHNPAVLSILIGINDLWRRFEPGKTADAVFPDEYEATYRELLRQAKVHCNPQMVLIEPFLFCNDPAQQMFKELPSYIQVVHRLAREFNAVIVPLQTYIDKEIAHVPPQKWSNDTVHPATWAHAWIAEKWLSATGL